MLRYRPALDRVFAASIAKSPSLSARTLAKRVSFVCYLVRTIYARCPFALSGTTENERAFTPSK